MKKLFIVFGIFLTIILTNSCEKKPEPPTLSTTTLTEISTTTAASGGNIISEGGSRVISRGVCWNTSDNPTIKHSKTNENSDLMSFTSNITELSPNTSYYVRAYATNSDGVGYGKSVGFKTSGEKPASNAFNVSNITLNSATLTGSVNPNLLSTTVTFEYGVSTSYGSTVTAPESPVSGDTTGNVTVKSNLTGLTPGTTYHFRITATNDLGSTSSEDMIFTTLGLVPAVETLAASLITINSATLTGSVNPHLLSTTVTFEYGVSTSYGSTVTALESPVSGDTTGNVTVKADLTGLTPGTTYHFKIIAINELGSTSSEDRIFTTLGQVPAVETPAASEITINSATLNSSVNPHLLSTTVTFEYGVSTSYGSTVTALESPVSGDNAGNVTVMANLAGLTPGTTYHFRTKATNDLGETNSSDKQFKTLGQVPEVETFAASNIQLSSFTFSGKVNPNYLPATLTCEWGTTTSYGESVVLQDSFSGNADQNFSGNITGLSPGTDYYFRIKATNELGTTYGGQQSIITNVSDYDGNIYHAVRIGTQVWLVENLKVTHYRNGNPINYVDINTAWSGVGNYCYYNNEFINSTVYGNLYNWYSTVDVRGISPPGWHVPTNSEWEILETYLGGQFLAGGPMKETGTLHWSSPNAGATNSTGFTALPGGRSAGTSFNIGSDGYWWSSTGYNDIYAWSVEIYTTGPMLSRHNNSHRVLGLSVRCIRDSE